MKGKPLSKQQQRDLDFARVSAVIDFVNEVDADAWRKHCLSVHAATWHAEFQAKRGQSADHLQLVSHG
ncbi:MAG TPA: hypothetical protein VMG31_03445 [Verrucomicrobiae bacterium]|nr:hypothetical protein [Verrucomicrobiae bacterium]